MDSGSVTTINGVVLDPVSNNNTKRVRRDVSFNNKSINKVPLENVRSRAMQAVEYYNSNVLSNNNNSRETYKALGDVYGQQQQQQSMFETKKQLGKNISMPMNGHQVRPARSMNSMAMDSNYKHVPLDRHNQHLQQQQQQVPGQQRIQYPRVLPAGQRFGSSDTRASYSERINGRHQGHQGPFNGQLTPQHRSMSAKKVMGGPVHGMSFVGDNNSRSAYNLSNEQRQQQLYKSSDSLEADHEADMVQEVMNNVTNGVGHQQHNRREFGSHGSLDVITRQEQNQLFPDIHSFDSNSMDGGACAGNGGITIGGPAAVSTLQRKPQMTTTELNRSNEESGTGSVMSSGSLDDSPKQKKKVSAGGFFSSSSNKADKEETSNKKGQKSLFKKLRGSSKEIESLNNNTNIGSKSSDGSDMGSLLDRQVEDRHRRRFFSHYDIGSVCASLSVTTHLKTLERRNTTTGASAASAALRSADSNYSSDNSAEKDSGDNVSSDLVLSCPYFRNEIGGEKERKIALTRQNSTSNCEQTTTTSTSSCYSHTPGVGRGFSLLDSNETFWKNGICPYKKVPGNVIEKLDEGATFYKNFFYGRDHQNWFGTDENLGPIAISIRRERILPSISSAVHNVLSSSVSLGPGINGMGSSFNSMDGSSLSSSSEKDQFLYRLLIRTSELLPLRGCVLEEAIPALKSEKIKNLPAKEVLEFAAPELQLSSLHLGIQSGPCEEELIRLDEAYVQNKYKVGLMYCREGQQTEEEMYNNEEGGAAFNEFLELIGQRVRLKGFNKYKAGLCNKNDSTGLYSVYKEHEGNEVMFHVSTLLPFTPNNKQQLPRKRYIGNDIVTVVFQEPEALPFIPNIKSQFQHVFIVVRVHNPCTESTEYSVAVTRSKSVPMFGPPLPPGGRFAKSKAFADFLLTKIINAETAAHKSDKFVSMAVRTRQELLKDLATNYVTPTTIESGSKFNLFGKKKDKLRPRFSPDISFLRGALSWRVVVEDCARSSQQTVAMTSAMNAKKGQVVLPTEVEAFIAISPDTLVMIQDNLHHDVLFITATRAIIGWTAANNSIRIYFHQGEALIIHSKDWETEDMSEISQRLKAVSQGAATQEFTLRRNQMGQLGFHVQHDGLITEVENFGYAWQTGLRQGSRLVEINKHAVTALSHEQMVELLKTSMMVTVTVIPPHPDGTPRTGCHLKNCPYAFGAPTSNSDMDGDYENLNGEITSTSTAATSTQPKGQQPSNSKIILDQNNRSMSPPRSSNSSGYGTGSSRNSSVPHENNLKQRMANNQLQKNIPEHMVMMNENNSRWYEFSDQHASSSNENSPPPPIPTRVIGSGANSAFQKVSSSASETQSSNSSSPNNIYQRLPMQRNVRTSNNTSSSNSAVTFSNYSTPPNIVNGFGDHSKLATVTIGGANLEQKQQQGQRESPEYSNQHVPLEEKRSGDAKVTYLTEYELNQPNLNSNVNNNNNNSSLLQHERLTALKSSSLPPEMVNRGKGLSTYVIDAGHNTDSSSNSDRNPVASGQEDADLSGSSRSVSPHRRRRGSNVPLVSSASLSHQHYHRGPPSTTSSSGSRNQSPKTISRPDEQQQQQQIGSVKKRSVSRNYAQNRNSANLTSSTFQEDLMKLISPEFEQMPRNKGNLNHTTSVSIGSRQINSNLSKQNYHHLSDADLMKSRSRENIARLSEVLNTTNNNNNNNGVTTTSSKGVNSSNNADASSESSFHMARPATVISNNSSMISSPSSANISARSERSFPTGQNQLKSNAIPLPDDKVMDWTALVDTANKAIRPNEGGNSKTLLNEKQQEHVEEAFESERNGKKSFSSESLSSSSDSPSCPSPASSSRLSEEQMGQLVAKVNQLETKLNSASIQKSHLEEEVASLREENLRLQEESQTASQQLKRFTEWFFQTIDKN